MTKLRGRPPLYDEAMKPYNVVLDLATVKHYKSRKLGNGNLSEGIRKGAIQRRKP